MRSRSRTKLHGRKKKKVTTVRKTYERWHDPSVLGEAGPNGGLAQWQGGAACGRVSRRPMGLRVRRRAPCCPIHHHIPTRATLH